eukprot:55939-Chlamydomonas_euryale.AAC.1
MDLQQQWKAARHYLPRLARGSGRRRLHPDRSMYYTRQFRGALAGRHSSVLRALIGSHQAKCSRGLLIRGGLLNHPRVIPTGRAKQAEQLSRMPRALAQRQHG